MGDAYVKDGGDSARGDALVVLPVFCWPTFMSNLLRSPCCLNLFLRDLYPEMWGIVSSSSMRYNELMVELSRDSVFEDEVRLCMSSFSDHRPK